MTAGVTLEYSIPGNTYSAGKTDFWDHVEALFGVALPPDVGLAGKGLSGEFDLHGDWFLAEGIPLTPFTDAAPSVEDAYQQALIILRDGQGVELSRSTPVMPVSTEVGCVASGCHSSELSILYQHEGPGEGGFDPADAPILCASCHGSPPLTGPNPGPEGYFSQVIHEKHKFIDEVYPGLAACQKCHPGPQTRCLRGTMANDHGMICQDCHGTMEQIEQSIDNGRTPWVEEPACRTCHTSTYGEPAGTLYRNAPGPRRAHVHGLPTTVRHAIFPSREARDNQVMVDLQGHAGTLSDCRVCHGVNPTGPGPHGVLASAVEDEILVGAADLRVFPAPFAVGDHCTIMAASRAARRRPVAGLRLAGAHGAHAAG